MSGVVKVAISSVNPAKKQASIDVCHKLFSSFAVSAEKIEGLPDQPIGHEETRECALIRARTVCQKNEFCH